MKWIKLFENFEEKKKTILILGLPGSGKSSLAKKIQRENPDKRYIIYDDFRSDSSLEGAGNENQIISDGMLMHTGADGFIKRLRERGIELEIIYFENDPQKAHFNVERRKSEGKQQKYISKIEIDHMSRTYGDMIRPETQTVPIWTDEFSNKK